MSEVKETVGVTKADIIDTIYASPECRLGMRALQEIVLKNKGIAPRPINGSPRDIDYSLSRQLRDMIASGMIGWDYNGHLIVTASFDQLREHYPPARDREFRLVPWKPQD